MDNFNVHKYYRDQYLAENKPVEEIIDYKKYNSLTDKYKKELESKIGHRPFISMGDYSQDRPDSDPLKGRGYGDITFMVREDYTPK